VQDETWPGRCSEILTEQERSDGARVTVTVSLYNYQRYIASCLESVKAQTMCKLDLIVVDDRSTDGGSDVVLKWLDANGGRFGRSSLIRHRTNRGLAATRNTAVAHARSEYVFVLDADNLLYPTCLERLATCLDNCAASFAYCYLEKFGAATGLQNLRSWNPGALGDGNTIDAMVLLRRSVWQTVGGYSTDMPHLGWEDYDLWFKIARMNGWGIQVPEILARYCVHRDSMIHTVTNPNADVLWQYFRARYPEFFSFESTEWWDVLGNGAAAV
jgi:glycosyltransferase involved in cell wall biosynthesis